MLLRRDGDHAQGRFDPVYGSFMPLRQADQAPASTDARPQRRADADRRTTRLDMTRPWEHAAFWFFANFTLPSGISFSLRADTADGPPTNTVLTAPDGS